ncbi:hypothetical protein KTT_52440 [Tengunoibacter tsumagoiensis]|uniref:Uncharacterized protein n=1 Tax=Tengunoibacter tsumagoiensis TaxID=2014871 RepID=A0A402A8T0_9CHLR|nr:hypothetical protein KTT_52440 [Tengunoibacter tsumagoiensis]
MRMEGRSCLEAWTQWLLEKLPVAERIDLKVLPSPTRSRLPFRERATPGR